MIKMLALQTVVFLPQEHVSSHLWIAMTIIFALKTLAILPQDVPSQMKVPLSALLLVRYVFLRQVNANLLKMNKA
jgi:hypothetical protein